MRAACAFVLVLLPTVCMAQTAPTFLRAWAAQGGNPGEFVNLTSVGVSPSGFIYAGDRTYIRKYDKDGLLVDMIDLVRLGGTSTWYGTDVLSLSVSPSNIIYWSGASAEDHEVWWSDSTGTMLNGEGAMCCGACAECGACMPYGSPIGIDARTSLGLYATDARWGQVCGPTEVRDLSGRVTGVAVDAVGTLFVTVWTSSNTNSDGAVWKFGADGTGLGSWAGSTEAGTFNMPSGIAVDEAGRVYVVDSGNNQIQVFSNDGQFLAAWGSAGDGPGQFSSPEGIALDADGTVYVADRGNQRIQQFQMPVGVRPTSWSDARGLYR